MSKTVPISRFKAQCLSLLDDVATTGEELIVTRRGRALARIEAMEEPRSLRNSVEYAEEADLIDPVEADWDAERS